MGKCELELVLSGNAAIERCLKVLDCDFDSFWKECIPGDYIPDENQTLFLGNMMLSINFHLRVMAGKVPALDHPGGRGNVPIKYKCTQDDMEAFVARAWNLVARRILDKDPDGKLTHLQAL